MIQETDLSSSLASFSRASFTSGSTWKVIFSCFGIYLILSEKIRKNQEFFKNPLDIYRIISDNIRYKQQIYGIICICVKEVL